ncbi:tripartite tricarboxylate transporter permease [Cloacibacillus sp. An23]|uniref:tripartite tricarboxylate transporter permease n=1 Tax=Cloacibacillus sp. An23 TaxID=1965591 RepID=UPI00130219BD|nr:tripartite tricarboxylate transporter permease [Cloacibacillus sp. An23]
MDLLTLLGGALDILINIKALLWILLGTFLGLVFGALPGLSATMAVALLIPLTFYLEPVVAISMLIGAYIGGIAGGAVSAILINIPGTPSSVVTTIDGHPMAVQGKAARALGWAAFSSGWGSIISWMLLVTIAPMLAKICTGFGAPEYAALAFFGLSIIAAVSGDSIMKGIIAGFIGVSLSFVGVDPIWGDLRFTFGSINLMGGISVVSALIGLYSIPQILNSCLDKDNEKLSAKDLTIKNIVPPFKEQFAHKVNIIRSSLIGTLIGIIPATGGNIAAFLAYDQAKRFSKEPETFGKGNVDGIIASEASNNGVCGGALIPMLTLGIPGDSVTAVLLGGLMIHGIQPGPMLFSDSPAFIGGIFTAVFIATMYMVLLQIFGIKIFVKTLNVPVNYLNAILVVLSLVGSYAIRQNFFDVILTLFFGVVGYILTKAKFPSAPIVLGLVLGSMFEGEFRRALKLGGGSISIFFERPIALVIIILAFAIIISTLWKSLKKETSAA